MSLVQRAADLAGQVQRLLVACPSLAQVTSCPAERPGLIEGGGFTVPGAEVAVDA